MCGCSAADRFSIAFEVEQMRSDCRRGGDADPHGADRFLRSAAAGTSDARDANAVGAAEGCAYVCCQQFRYFPADCADGVQNFLWYVQKTFFCFIAVYDDAAQEVPGAAGNIGDAFA